MPCIFDKIAAHEIPATIVYEDEQCIAFLDNSPVVKGHTLVIPKQHAETLLELPLESVGPLFVAVKKTMEILQEKLHPDGFNTGWNHNKAGGQAVPHLHVHILPRWHGDGGGSLHSIFAQPKTVDKDAVASLFKK